MGYNRATAGGAIAAPSCESSSIFATVRDYIELTKPRITWLILMSTGIGYFFGAQRRLELAGRFSTRSSARA